MRLLSAFCSDYKISVASYKLEKLIKFFESTFLFKKLNNKKADSQTY